jgi:hypothetical protein
MKNKKNIVKVEKSTPKASNAVLLFTCNNGAMHNREHDCVTGHCRKPKYRPDYNNY